MGKITIPEGVSKLDILYEMWRRMPPASFYAMTGTRPPVWDEQQALSALRNGYIDYLLGRCIKTDFSTNILESNAYNRDAGQWTLENIIQSLSAKLCPFCSSKIDSPEVICDNDCGTLVCSCDSEIWQDKHGNLQKGHNPKCGKDSIDDEA
jgi:hypothetical protein